MKDKGFTLVELLAVIVILAVISLIAVPMILGIIEETKKSSFKDSVLSAFDAVEYYVIDNELGDIPENGIAANLLKMKNNNFESGRFIKNIDGNLIAEFVSDGKYCATGSLTNLNISKGECEISAPSVAVEVNGKESIITIIDENGIVAYAVTTNSEEPEEWTDIEETTRLEQNLTASSPGTYYIHVRNKYGKKITKEYIVEESAFCEYELGAEWVFDYTGGEQELVIPCSGTYKLETWGAQGATASSEHDGGYGAYATGTVKLYYNDLLYINAAGSGNDLIGGYNGGGTANTSIIQTGAGGGGATSVATKSGLLSSFENNSEKSIDDIIIVAAGGGGTGFSSDGNYSGIGGSGGGIQGNDGIDSTSWKYYYGTGATQLLGGDSYASLSDVIQSGEFGQGGNGRGNYEGGGGSGGGAGLFGGGGSSRGHGGAGGGSSYIGNSLLTNKVMYCYDCEESQKEATKTISTTGDNADRDSCPNGYSSDPISNCAKAGNGYARITYLGN